MTAERMTTKKAIRLYCLECGGGQYAEVRLCPVVNCHLYPYRMGRKIKSTNTAKTEGEKPEAEELSGMPPKIEPRTNQGHCSTIIKKEDATL